MAPEALFLTTLLLVSALAAYVAHGMFAVGTMKEIEKSKMYFAASVLAFLAFIFMLAALLYALAPKAMNGSTDSAGKEIFDACVKIIPPMVTLIIGFYFGASQAGGQSAHDKPSATRPNASVPKQRGQRSRRRHRAAGGGEHHGIRLEREADATPRMRY